MSIYKFNYEGKKKEFQYDREKAQVSYVMKATEEEIADNEEWMKKYGKPLFEIQKDGFMVINAVGLRRENWDNKEARNEYLYEWCMRMEEEIAHMIKNEFPSEAVETAGTIREGRKSGKECLEHIKTVISEERHLIICSQKDRQSAIEKIDSILNSKYIEYLDFVSDWHVDIFKHECGHFEVLQHPVYEDETKAHAIFRMSNEAKTRKCSCCITGRI